MESLEAIAGGADVEKEEQNVEDQIVVDTGVQAPTKRSERLKGKRVKV